MYDIQEDTLRVSVKGGEITLKSLISLIKTTIDNKGRIEHGEQSLKKLNMQNRQLESVPITREDLKLLRSELKKFSVDFSIQKDGSEHIVFFKGQDVERVYKGLEKCVKNFEKKPMKEQFAEAEKKMAAIASQKQQTKERGSHDREKGERAK